VKLSVIIPVFNEKNTVLEIVKRVLAVPLDKEVVIVDDGSTDGTSEILKSPQMRQLVDQSGCEGIKIVFQKQNQGKGAAIKRGLEEVTGDAVVIQDADLEYDPMDFLALIKPIEEGRADVVYGSRILGHNRKSSFSFHYGGKLLTFVTNFLYRTHITDQPTCYKMFRTEVLNEFELSSRSFEFCSEVTAKLAKRGHRIMELPIRYVPRSIREGKKIRWKDGLIAIWTLIKYRFTG
jgi:glycosyltransferase involved in cell wall biosynthesis